MQVTKKELKKSEVELIIEVSTEETRPFLEKAAARVSQGLKIEGFRPGKAPYHIVKQKAGEMAIYQEGLDNIVSHFFIEAIKQEELNSVGSPRIEMEKVAPGNPIVFKAIVSLMPEVKLGDYKKVKVEKKEVKV
ncbi:MAG TPA: trigger factor family protein [Patescibacteria group bacterium]|nr:trigger factor family protein [Patescibacteria group bacterium]